VTSASRCVSPWGGGRWCLPKPTARPWWRRFKALFPRPRRAGFDKSPRGPLDDRVGVYEKMTGDERAVLLSRMRGRDVRVAAPSSATRSD
jgi:hypothetical protein